MEQHTILIADRNRNVREFLKREMRLEGCRVLTAANAAQVLNAVSSDRPPEIVVLDLDLPDAGGTGIIGEIRAYAPRVPVIIHTLACGADPPRMNSLVKFVEKQENSIEELKRMVCDLLDGLSTLPSGMTADAAPTQTDGP